MTSHQQKLFSLEYPQIREGDFALFDTIWIKTQQENTLFERSQLFISSFALLAMQQLRSDRENPKFSLRLQSRLERTRSLPEKQILNYLSELVQSWIFLPSIPCLFNWVQLMRKILNWGCANDTPWTVSTRQIPNLHWQIFPVLSFLCRRLFFHSPTFMHNHTRSFTKRSEKVVLAFQ